MQHHEAVQKDLNHSSLPTPTRHDSGGWEGAISSLISHILPRLHSFLSPLPPLGSFRSFLTPISPLFFDIMWKEEFTGPINLSLIILLTVNIYSVIQYFFSLGCIRVTKCVESHSPLLIIVWIAIHLFLYQGSWWKEKYPILSLDISQEQQVTHNRSTCPSTLSELVDE